MLNPQIITDQQTLKDALRRLDALAIPGGTLFVVDEAGRLLGTLTDGDIRRGLLRDLDVHSPAVEAAHREFRYVTEGEDNAKQLKTFKKQNFRFIPVLRNDHTLVDILDLQAYAGFLPVEAVLMAGGQGKRLLPLTATVPKPMLEVGGKPILEHNIDRLARFGVRRLHLSVNYLAEAISGYFGSGAERGLDIRYIRETEPLGTLGSVRLADGFEQDVLLVMNSDLLTTIDYEDFYEAFVAAGADMAVATIPYHADVPYAVLDIDDEQRVSAIREKPRYTFYANAGIYLLRRELLDLLPPEGPYDTPDLMEEVIRTGRRLISFPILGYWLDIGRMNDYLKAQEDIKHLAL